MKKELLAQGKKITYQDMGSGKPVILVHGFGETGAVWDRQVDFLQHQFRLLVPNLPGSGDSEPIAEMSMEGMAAVIKQLADQEKLDQFILVGHSMGGYISLAFAEQYPQQLRGLGLFHSSAYADNEEKKSTRRKGIEFIREHGAFAFLKNTSPKLFAPRTREEKPELIDEFIGSLSKFSASSLVLYYEAMMQRPDRTEVLKKAQYPVLFIMGEHDTAIPLADGLKLCQLPEKAYFYKLSSSGHMGMLEETQKSNSSLLQFLTEAELF